MKHGQCIFKWLYNCYYNVIASTAIFAHNRKYKYSSDVNLGSFLQTRLAVTNAQSKWVRIIIKNISVCLNKLLLIKITHNENK